MFRLKKGYYRGITVVRPERFELPTKWFEATYSIQLSYGRTLDVLLENGSHCNRRFNRRPVLWHKLRYKYLI